MFLQDAFLILDARMTAPQLLRVGEGTVGLFSARHPFKETANEDAAAVLPAVLPDGEKVVVLAVADGLGGNAAGEEAARLAIEALKDALDVSFSVANEGVILVSEPIPEFPSAPPAPSLRTAILNGFEEANRRILALGSGAATTLAVVEISGRTMRPYHVGDSLILLTGGRGKIKVRTIAHSPVGYGVAAGLIDSAEAIHHEERHLVSNVVGCPEMRIEIGPARILAPRDTLLLASDGLSDNLHLEEIVETIRKGPLEKAMNKLAALARQRMQDAADELPSKPDDLTVLLYRPVTASARKPAGKIPEDETAEKEMVSPLPPA